MLGRLIALVAILLMAALAPIPANSQSHEAHIEPFEVDSRWRLLDRSPDGTMIAATDIGPRNLCTFAVPSGAEIACADLAGSEIDLREEDLSWAPDSSAVVFAEEGLITFRDGDLWRFDARTGDLTNLTDDGVSANLPILSRANEEGTYHVDVAPAWSPDGATIAFSRSTFEGGGNVPSELWTLDVATGKQTMLARFDLGVGGVLFYGMVWSPDMSSIFVSVSHRIARDERNGVWSVSTTSGEATQLTGPSAWLDGRAPSVLTVSPNGDHLVLEYPSLIGASEPDDNRSGYALLHLDSGQVTSIDAPGGSPDTAPVPVGPTFSPTGDHLVFAVRNPKAGHGTVVARHLETGAETTIATLPGGAQPVIGEAGDPLIIATDGTSLIRTERFTGYLVHLPNDLLEPTPTAG